MACASAPLGTMSASEARGVGAGAPVPARVSTGAHAGAACRSSGRGAASRSGAASAGCERDRQTWVAAARDEERMASGHTGTNGRIDSAGCGEGGVKVI
jgi:hypothetical protein